jgi:hypothetical protein
MIDNSDLLANGARQYQSKKQHGRRVCYLSMRANNSHLIIKPTNEALDEAGITIGSDVDIFFDEKTITIVADECGTVRVRKEGTTTALPYLLVPIGPDKMLDCRFTDGMNDGHHCEQHIDDKGRLVLALPDTVVLTLQAT